MATDAMTADAVHVHAYDPASVDQGVLLGAFRLLEVEDAELRPEDPPFTWDEFAGLERSVVPDERRLRWLASDANGRPVGRACLNLPTTANQHLAVIELYVSPGERRAGVGRSLLRSVVEAARADGRTTALCHVHEGSDGDGFASRFGATVALSDRISGLDLRAVDVTMLRRWVEVGEAADGYALVTYERRCPEEWLDAFTVVRAAMNFAPVGDLAIGDRVHTPESVRRHEDELIAGHLERWTMAVVHEPTGVFAGFTEITLAESAPAHAWQGGTAVLPAFRGHGFGRWIKAAMALRLLEQRPAIVAVDTENAYGNAPMLAINTDMGFTLLRTINEWQAPLATLHDALEPTT
jgi:mycothiol synthase